MKWFRWHHGTATDPKWRLIARRAERPLAEVLALWPLILEHASDHDEERGSIEEFDTEVAAVALDLEPEHVAAIWDAMEGRVHDGTRLTGWDKRQPKRERPKDNSGERVRRYRERQKAQSDATEDTVTPCNAKKHPEERRGDKSINSSNGGSGDPPSPKKRFPAIPPKHGPNYAYPEEFEATWSAYPARDGPNAKLGAYKAWRARVVRGEKPEDLLAAAQNYAAHAAVKEIEGTGYVQQAETFFGPREPFREFVEDAHLNGSGKPKKKRKRELSPEDEAEILRQKQATERALGT